MYSKTDLATLLTPRLAADAAALATSSTEHDGGFALHFDMGTMVTVELVGKGFQSTDLTSGRAVHESYTVLWPWSGCLRTRADLQRHATQQLTPPSDYEPVSDAAVQRLLNDALRYICKQPCFMQSLGLQQFIVRGDFIHDSPVVWDVTPCGATLSMLIYPDLWAHGGPPRLYRATMPPLSW